jgi:cytochrome bd-type quinol oxidase subunit 2
MTTQAIVLIFIASVIGAFMFGFVFGYFRGMDAADEIERGNW